MNKMEPDRISSPPYTRMRRRIRFSSPRVWLVIIALAAVGGYLVYANPFGGSGAGGGAGPGGFNRGQAPAPPVHVATAETKDVPVVVRTIGTVLANATVQVKSQIDGQILSAPFREGQMVKAGDLLFEIDPAPYEAALRQAQATLAKDEAQAAAAKSDAERNASMVARGIVSAQQNETATANAAATAATALADRANVEKAQLELGYTKIRSPINGKTGPILVNPGNLVKANDTTYLVSVTQIQPVKISFSLPQSDVPILQDRMKSGELEASLTQRADSSLAAVAVDNQDIDVKVDFIGNSIDARTGTIELRATSDNPDLRLVPGELVDVRVVLNTLHNVVTAPPEAVNVGPNGNFVYVVGDDKKAEMRSVKIAYQDDTLAAVSDGLKAGERVVTEGQLRVIAGSPVAIAGEPGQGGPGGQGQNNFRGQGGGNGQGRRANGQGANGQGNGQPQANSQSQGTGQTAP
jgi:multidrug efflux system membrane fusion protein